jgi:hypothetical protein
MLVVSLAAVGLLFCGYRLGARADDPPAKPEKKGQDAKPDKPEAPPMDPQQRALQAQFELMEEMMKSLRKPGGATPDDLNRMMQKAMQAAMQGQGQFPPLPALNPFGAGPTDYVDRRLGAQLKPVSEELIQQLDLPEGKGQVVVGVTPGSPAEKAGLKPSDILLELNDKPVSRNTAEFTQALEGVKPETPVNAVVLRKGVKADLKGLMLKDAPPPAQQGFPNFPAPNFGPPAFPAFPAQGMRLGRPDLNLPLGARANRLGGQGNFTSTHREGALAITVTGTVNNGNVTVTNVTIQDGAVTNQYDRLNLVPEAHRERVTKMIENAVGRPGRE